MNKLDNEKLISLVVYKLKDTLFNLMYDILDNPVNEISNPPDSIKEFEEKIRQLYTEISDNLGQEITDRESFVSKLNLLEAEIVKKAIAINRYTCANNQLGEYVLREMKLIEVSHIGEDIPLNNHAMAEKAEHYISHLENNIEGMFSKGQLISALPLRMTKAKYRDYIKSGFNAMAQELPPEFAAASMERLKDMCFADISDMSADLPLMSQSIEEIYKLDTSSFDKENIEEYLNIIDDNINQLQNIYSCLGVLYNDVTYMKILADFVIDEDFLFEDDFILKDLYYSICNTITENNNTLVDTIIEKVSNEIEERFEKSKELEAEISEAISKLNDINDLDENAKVSVQVNNAISNAYLKDIDQHIMLGMGNDKTIEELSDELCAYIENAVSELAAVRKKYIKQKFLQHIPCTMSDSEFIDYTHYALGGVNDRNILLMCCGDIFDITDKAEHEHHHHNHEHHHHHEHGEHCGCGHHH